MPLLFCDLDNTLSDRASSFDAWARDYVTERFGELDEGLVAEMIRADGDGHRNKREAAADYAELLGLSDAERDEIIAVMRAGTLKRLQPAAGVAEALDRARAAGFRPFIVTNGNQAQQEGKVARLGLEVDGIVVSEGVGVAKPDPRIFTLAAQAAGGSLEGAWMIGDTATADIAGAHAAGIASVWLSRGRRYPSSVVGPTIIAASFGEAVDAITREVGS